MKTYKFLAVAAVFGCYVFGGVGASAQQICPIGGGACVPNPTPASSYSTARAVDVTRAPVAPVIVVDQTPAPGSYCGWAAADPSTEGGSYSNYPCQGHRVAFMVTGTVFADCPAGYQSITTGVNGSAIWYSCLKL